MPCSSGGKWQQFPTTPVNEQNEKSGRPRKPRLNDDEVASVKQAIRQQFSDNFNAFYRDILEEVSDTKNGQYHGFPKPDDVDTVASAFKNAFKRPMEKARPLPEIYWRAMTEILGVTRESLGADQKTESSGECSPNVLSKTADEAKERPLAKRQLPWRIPSRKWDATVDPPGALLLAEMQTVRFHYRKEEIDSFSNWCGTPEWFAARTVVGSGGMGKTRLALEICQLMLKQAWRGGFIDYRFDHSDETWCSLLADSTPTLLVFDYAESHVEKVEAVLGQIARHKPNKVRILLLARNAGRPGDWWDQLRMKRLAGDLMKGPAQELVRLKPVSLTRGDRAESHRQAQEAFARILDKTLPDSSSQSDFTDSYFDRVLLLHMHALAFLDGRQIQGGDEILDYVLDRERRYWSEMLAHNKIATSVVGIEEFDQAMVLATYLGGINQRADATRILSGLPCFERLGSDEVARKINVLSPLLHDCYGANKWIEPVQPDLLGQRLFDRAIHGDGHVKKKLFALVAKLDSK